jgi:hypothetical protein
MKQVEKKYGFSPPAPPPTPHTFMPTIPPAPNATKAPATPAAAQPVEAITPSKRRLQQRQTPTLQA